MTAPAPLDLPALLDDLERAHAAALSARNAYPSLPELEAIHNDGADQVIAVWSDDATAVFAETFDPESSDLIAEAVNWLPPLVAAVRGILDLADEWDTRSDARYAHNRIAKETAARALHATLAAALSPESVTS